MRQPQSTDFSRRGPVAPPPGPFVPEIRNADLAAVRRFLLDDRGTQPLFGGRSEATRDALPLRRRVDRLRSQAADAGKPSPAESPERPG